MEFRRLAGENVRPRPSIVIMWQLMDDDGEKNDECCLVDAVGAHREFHERSVSLDTTNCHEGCNIMNDNLVYRETCLLSDDGTGSMQIQRIVVLSNRVIHIVVLMPWTGLIYHCDDSSIIQTARSP